MLADTSGTTGNPKGVVQTHRKPCGSRSLASALAVDAVTSPPSSASLTCSCRRHHRLLPLRAPNESLYHRQHSHAAPGGKGPDGRQVVRRGEVLRAVAHRTARLRHLYGPALPRDRQPPHLPHGAAQRPQDPLHAKMGSDRCVATGGPAQGQLLDWRPHHGPGSPGAPRL